MRDSILVKDQPYFSVRYLFLNPPRSQPAAQQVLMDNLTPASWLALFHITLKDQRSTAVLRQRWI